VIGWRIVDQFEGSGNPRDWKIQRMALLKLLSRSSGVVQRRTVRSELLEVWKSTLHNVPPKVRLERSTTSMICVLVQDFVYNIKATDEL